MQAPAREDDTGKKRTQVTGKRRRRSPPRSKKRDTADLEHNESGDVDNGLSAARLRVRGSGVDSGGGGPTKSGGAWFPIFEGRKQARGGIERVETVDCGPEVEEPESDTGRSGELDYG